MSTETETEAAAREAAYWAKIERQDRWRRALSSPRDRFRAWMNMIFIDHAFFRLVYLNKHRIGPDAWRSAQPWPHQVRALGRAGLKTIVNLRGGQSYGSLPLEIEACAESGIAFESFVLRSRSIPTVEELRDIKTLFSTIAYPALFHCKSGADRAGMMSALYLALHLGRPVREAQRQLGLRYGHFSRGPTGVLDAFFEAYLADHPDDDVPLMDWIEACYDPAKVTAAFKAGAMGSFVTETLLRRE